MSVLSDLMIAIRGDSTGGQAHVKAISDSMLHAGDEIDKVKKKLLGFTTSGARDMKTLRGAVKPISTVFDSMKQSATGVDGSVKKINKPLEGMANYYRQVEQLSNSFLKLDTGVGVTSQGLTDTANRMAILRQQLRAGEITTVTNREEIDKYSRSLSLAAANLRRKAATLTQTTAEQKEYTRSVMQANRQVNLFGLKFAPEALTGLNQLSSASHGAMLGMGLLSNNLMQVGFSLIFLKFSIPKISLAFAALTTATILAWRQLTKATNVSKDMQSLTKQTQVFGYAADLTQDQVEIISLAMGKMGVDSTDATKAMAKLASAGITPTYPEFEQIIKMSYATGQSVESLVDSLLGLVDPLGIGMTDFNSFRTALTKIVPAVVRLKDGTVGAIEADADWFSQIAGLLEGGDRLSTLLGLISNDWTTLQDVQGPIIDQEGNLVDRIKTLLGILAGATGNIETFGEALADLGKEGFNADTALQLLVLFMSELAKEDGSVAAAQSKMKSWLMDQGYTEGDAYKAVTTIWSYVEKLTGPHTVGFDVEDAEKWNANFLRWYGILKGPAQGYKPEVELVGTSKIETTLKDIRDTLSATYYPTVAWQQIAYGTPPNPMEEEINTWTSSAPLNATRGVPSSTININMQGSNIMSEHIPDEFVDQLSLSLGKQLDVSGAVTRTRR